MDEWLFHLINERWTNPALDLFMAGLSNVEIWRPLLVGIVIYLLVFGRFRGRACVACILVTLAVAEQVTGGLKSAIDRHRPKQVQTVRLVQLQNTHPAFMTLLKTPTVRFSNQSDRNRSGPSFPSGHMTNNTVIALYLTLFYRRGWLYWIITALMGYSRIYLGAHWPSDIVATLFLAIGETLLLLAMLELLWRWAGARWWPRLHRTHPRLLPELPR